MAGALKAGSVYVAVSAAIGEFTKSLRGIVKSVEQMAARVKAAAAPLAEVGTLFAAGMAGAVLAASKSNARLAADLEKLKATVYTLAAELGDAFAPMVRSFTQAVSSIVGAFQRLSPETKEAIARTIAFMAVMGAGAAIIVRVATLVEGLAKVVGLVLVPALSKAAVALEAGMAKGAASMVASFGAALAPIAAVGAAVVGVALLAGTLYEAWSDSGTGMRDAILSAWGAIKDLGKRLAETLAGWWSSLKAFILDGLRVVLDAVAGAVKQLSSVLAPLYRGLGITKVASVFEDLQQLTGEKLLKSLQDGSSFLADKATSAARTLADGAVEVGKQVAEGVSYGLSYSLKGVKRIGVDTGLAQLPDKLKAALAGVRGLFGGAGPRLRAPGMPQVEVALAGKAVLTESIRELASGADVISRAASKMMEERAKALAEAMAEAAKAAAERVRQARQELLQRFTSAFGDLAELVNSFQQGMQAGGIWGGIIAVILDLFTRSQQFARLVEVLSGIIAMAADVVGKLAEPFIPLLGAVSMIISAGLDALAPAFSLLAAIIEPLVPPLVAVSQVLQALAPLMGMLVAMGTLLIQPLMMLAGPTMKALFEVLKLVGRGILWVARAIAGMWNAIIGAIQSVFRSLGSISILGKKPLSFLTGWADGLNGAMVSTDAMTEAMHNLAGLTWEQAQAAAAQTAETVRNARELQKANEELTNVPNAFKAALRRYESQAAQSTFTGAGGLSTVPVSTMPSPAGGWSSGTISPWGGTGAGPGRPPPGEATGPSSVLRIDTITINTTNAAESAAQLEKTLDSVAYKLTGSRGRAGRWAVPEGA